MISGAGIPSLGGTEESHAGGREAGGQLNGGGTAGRSLPG